MAEKQSKLGGGSFPMPWQALDIINEDQQYKDPISADRWLSLVKKGGHEDFFSSDLDDATLKEIFAGLKNSGKPILFVMSGKDECVPKHVKIQDLAHRFVQAASGGTATVGAHVIEDAGHSVESQAARVELTRVVLDFISRIP
jgi:pimeloyl-ACP methyl ester carboxylesterase